MMGDEELHLHGAIVMDMNEDMIEKDEAIPFLLNTEEGSEETSVTEETNEGQTRHSALDLSRESLIDISGDAVNESVLNTTKESAMGKKEKTRCIKAARKRWTSAEVMTLLYLCVHHRQLYTENHELFITRVHNVLGPRFAISAAQIRFKLKNMKSKNGRNSLKPKEIMLFNAFLDNSRDSDLPYFYQSEMKDWICETEPDSTHPLDFMQENTLKLDFILETQPDGLSEQTASSAHVEKEHRFLATQNLTQNVQEQPHTLKSESSVELQTTVHQNTNQDVSSDGIMGLMQAQNRMMERMLILLERIAKAVETSPPSTNSFSENS
eukprot:TRINITY_DN12296_c0_g1_i1.p1 TRINITY_DN12296_c0_g1~~TRINITY_DN12296_c0_g1_i1.p1  ORF type:complete len:324 (+),score=72.95 TRINITY_DN12296_c0_g1_i1:51-1022(+)